MHQGGPSAFQADIGRKAQFVGQSLGNATGLAQGAIQQFGFIGHIGGHVQGPIEEHPEQILGFVFFDVLASGSQNGANLGQHLLHLERLGQVGPDLQPFGFGRLRFAGVTADDHAADLRLETLGLFDRFESPDAFHSNISQDQVKLGGLGHFHGGLAPIYGGDLVAFVLQDFGQDGSEVIVVFQNENARHETEHFPFLE